MDFNSNKNAIFENRKRYKNIYGINSIILILYIRKFLMVSIRKTIMQTIDNHLCIF